MKRIFVTFILLQSLFLLGCSQLQKQQESPKTESSNIIPVVKQKNEQKLSFATKINNALQAGTTIEEAGKPNIVLPSGIHEAQIQKYFQFNPPVPILFAIVQRPSLNIVLPGLPSDYYNPIFTGVLVAEASDTQWSKLVEIQDKSQKDIIPAPKNNPYYLWQKDGKLLLSIVDQNGAGSGEGLMKVFALSKNGNWHLTGCYYFGFYVTGDYFAFTKELSKHKLLPLENCSNVTLIPH